MNQSFGIFDVFVNAIPGSLYLLVAAYLGLRFGWFELNDLDALNTTFAVTGTLLVSYLLGHLAAPHALRLVERAPLWRQIGRRSNGNRAQSDFVRRNPTLAHRKFLHADAHTLLAGVRHSAPEAATQVDRLRATGLLLRSVSPAFLLGALIALGEVGATRRLVAAVLAVGLVTAGGLALREGHKFHRWANISTYEHAAWLPDVEARLGLDEPDKQAPD